MRLFLSSHRINVNKKDILSALLIAKWYTYSFKCRLSKYIDTPGVKTIKQYRRESVF